MEVRHESLSQLEQVRRKENAALAYVLCECPRVHTFGIWKEEGKCSLGEISYRI